MGKAEVDGTKITAQAGAMLSKIANTALQTHCLPPVPTITSLVVTRQRISVLLPQICTSVRSFRMAGTGIYPSAADHR